MKKRSMWKLFVCFVIRLRLTGFLSRFTDAFQLNKNCQSRINFPFVKRRRSRNCQILAYHRVNDDEDVFFPGVPVARFEEQMNLVMEHFTVCPLKELVQRMKDDDLPENAIAVTFDDGYRDNYLNALPVLKRYAVPATIFLATGVIGSGKALWHDRVFDAFRQTKVPELIGLVPGSTRLCLTPLKAKLEAQRHVLEHLWSLDGDDRELAIDRLRDRLDVAETKSDICRLMLSWEEVSDMNADGIQFGAHTVTHPILSRLGDEAARQEVCASKTTIEEVLNTTVTSFAYPVGRCGDFNATTKAIVEEAGFYCGVTMIFGNNHVETDLYEMRRIAAWNEDSEAFGLRLRYYKFCS